MKKTQIFKFFPVLALAAGAIAFTSSFKKSYVSTHAETVSSIETDVTGNRNWMAKDGKFVNVPNWYNSGLGLSFEFKVANPTAMVKNQHVMLGYYNESGTKTDLLSTGFYVVDGVEGKSFSNGTTSVGKFTLLDADQGWGRYEVMFADIPNVKEENKTLTLNGMNFDWYNSEIVSYRNMEIISGYRVIGETPKLYSTLNNSRYLNANYGEMIKVPNWHTSGLGFSFEFLPTVQQDANMKLITPDWKELTGLFYYYKAGYKCDFGRLIQLENGWLRYEVLFSDLTCTGAEDATFSILLIEGWEGYTTKSDFRNVRAISQYTETAANDAKTWADNFLTATDGVCNADGTTVLADLQSVWTTANNNYSALSADAKVLLNYSDKIGNAISDKTSIDNALARYEYIYSKYPTLDNSLPIRMAKMSSLSSGNVQNLNTDKWILISLTASSLTIIAVALVLKKRKALK